MELELFAERLRLTPLAVTDLDVALELWTDPEVVKYVCDVVAAVASRDDVQLLARCASTIQTPPRVATDANNSRVVTSSDMNATPPRAAIAGTDSCTVAALVAASPFIASYQIAYPIPDVTPPEIAASASPTVVT